MNEDKDWIQEKCNTNKPPTNLPVNSSVWNKSNRRNKKLLLTSLKFINHLRENNILDEIEIGNTSCENCLSKIDLFYKLYAQYFGDINFDIRKEIEKLEECKENFSLSIYVYYKTKTF